MQGEGTSECTQKKAWDHNILGLRCLGNTALWVSHSVGDAALLGTMRRKQEILNVSICSRFSPSAASQLRGYWGVKGREGLLHKTSVQSGFPDSGKREALPYSDWRRSNPRLYPKGILGSLGSWLLWPFVNSRVKQMQSLEEGA